MCLVDWTLWDVVLVMRIATYLSAYDHLASIISNRVVQESAEDQRCRCVCPLLEKSMAKNTTLPLMVKGQDYSKKVVYIKRNVQPEDWSVFPFTISI